ncbi:hypothetical protein [Bradyrhizobium sp. USDA 4451]
MSLLWFAAIGLVTAWVAPKAKRVFTADYRDDPTYKKNLQRLIERNRQFEEAKE